MVFSSVIRMALEFSQCRGLRFPVKTAQEISSENLSKPIIQARLAHLRESMAVSATQTLNALERRKHRLQEIVDHPIETPVSAGHRVAAAKELNLMERVYQDGSAGKPGIVNITYVFNSLPSAQSTQCLPETPKIIEIEQPKVDETKLK